MERRQEHPRLEVEIEVQYRTAQEFLSAYSRNLSGGGIFVWTPEPLPPNHAVHLRFSLPGIADCFEVSGVVVWSNPGSSRSFLPPGMGVRFVDLDPRSRELINEFVKSKSPSPRLEKGR
jgi:type IV pilus assembly protein PilZ